jgi:hypothetical protein
MPLCCPRPQALECISLVGMAVGRDRFREAAAQVLAFMKHVSEVRPGSLRRLGVADL